MDGIGTYTLTGICFLVTITIWLTVTSPFLESHRHEPHTHNPFSIVAVVVDFFRAINVGLSDGIKIPFGVWFHGAMIAMTIVAAFRTFVVSVA